MRACARDSARHRCKAQPTLVGLELGADKTDIERLPIQLNEKFSPSTLSYTATVEASYTEFLYVTPKLSSNQGAAVKINGADAKPGEASKVPLSLGENKISIVSDSIRR